MEHKDSKANACSLSSPKSSQNNQGSTSRASESPKVQKGSGIPLKLDTSGQYLLVGRKRSVRVSSQVPVDIVAERVCFLSNAFLFYAYADEILKDDKMRYAKIPFQSSMAYTGISGFEHPTLGVYVEWWKKHNVIVCSDNERPELLYRLAGSPLSGSNSCSVVGVDGVSHSLFYPEFSRAWGSFMEVNRQEKPKDLMDKAYSLQSVVEILKQKDLLEHRLALSVGNLELYLLRLAQGQYKAKLEEDKKKISELTEEIYEYRIRLNYVAAQSFYSEYVRLKKECDNELLELSEQKRVWKQLVAEKTVSGKEAQDFFITNRFQRRKIREELDEFVRGSLADIFGENLVPLDAVVRYFKNQS